MKVILFVFHCSTIGGGSYCLLNILKNLDRAKYIPKVLLAYNGPLVDEIRKLGIDVTFYKKLDSIPYNLSLWKKGTLAKYYRIEESLKGFVGVLNDIAPDLVYINSMMLYPYLKPAKKAGFRTILHIREHWPITEHTKQLKRAQKYIQQYADHVIAINHFASKQVPNIEYKTSIVYDWVDFSDRNADVKLSAIFREDVSDKQVLLFTGGCAPNKGAKEVAQLFSSQLPNEHLRLLVLGNSMKQYGNNWKERIKMWLSDHGFRSFYGYELNKIIKADKRIVCIPNTYEIKPLFDQCTCLVSYFTIPHANLALAEAIINNTVVVAAETEESMEYSLNGDLAFLFKINNASEFVGAVRSALQQNMFMKQKLANRSAIVKKLFDKDRNVSILLNVFEEMMH